MRRGLLLTALAAALLSALGTGAQAAFGDFTYTTAVTPTTLPGTDGVVITLTPLNDSTPLSSIQNGGTDITFGRITVDTTNLADGTTVTLTNVPYTFALTLTDLASNTTDTVNITGKLSGTVGKDSVGASSVNITNTYSPTSYATMNFPPVYAFDVSGLQSYVAPGPGATLSGGFGAHVAAAGVPEPASALLLGLGGLGIAALRRRRSA